MSRSTFWFTTWERFRPLLLGLLVGLAIALAPGLARAQGSAALVIAAGEVRHGDVATLDQPIEVYGIVEGDVTSWSGTIIVSGHVLGDVVSYVGRVELSPGAQVDGNVLSVGGGVARETEAQVQGRILGEKPMASGAMAANIAVIFDQPAVTGARLPRVLVSIMLAVAALLFCLASVLVWPRRTAGMSYTLSRAPWRSISVGLLTTALLGLLALPIVGLLALSLVGLPLIFPLALLLQIPYLFGLTALGQALARRLGLCISDAAATAAGVAACLIPLCLIGTIAPLWSATLFYLVASAGLGAAVLSRGGAFMVAPARQ